MSSRFEESIYHIPTYVCTSPFLSSRYHAMEDGRWKMEDGRWKMEVVVVVVVVSMYIGEY